MDKPGEKHSGQMKGHGDQVEAVSRSECRLGSVGEGVYKEEGMHGTGETLGALLRSILILH